MSRRTPARRRTNGTATAAFVVLGLLVAPGAVAAPVTDQTELGSTAVKGYDPLRSGHTWDSAPLAGHTWYSYSRSGHTWDRQPALGSAAAGADRRTTTATP